MRDIGADLQLQLVPCPAEVAGMSFLPTSSLANVPIAGRASAAPGLMPVPVLLGFYYYFPFFCCCFIFVVVVAFRFSEGAALVVP